MKIILLTEQDLEETLSLTNSVFVREAAKGYPELAYLASLDNEPAASYVRKSGTDFLRYWIAKEAKILGTIGIYRITEKPTFGWIGWFCVAPDARGKKIGRSLLAFAIEEAKRLDYKELWLYTSKDPNEAIAQLLYEKFGFEIMSEEDDEPCAMLYRRLVL